MNTTRRLRSAALLIALLLCLPAIPAFAETPPAFFIETIDVRNVRRASPQVVRSESLLREGQAYTEQQLQDAQSRIRRLPFVLDVEFSLEKGSRRDAYVLVMKVDEAAPFFVGVQHFLTPAHDGRPSSNSTTADVGTRWFVGDYGQLHATVGGNFDGGPKSVVLGYTQYNLLRRSIFFSASVATGLGDGYQGFSGSSLLGVPLRGNHSLRVHLDTYHSDNDEHSFGSEGGNLGLSWLYDTTNDALFPTAGTTLVAGVDRGRSETHGIVFIGPEPGPLPGETREFTIDSTSLQLTGRRYWPVRELDAIVVEARAGYSETSPGLGPSRESKGLSAMAAYSGSLWGLEKTRKHGDLRYEVGISGTRSSSQYDAIGAPEFTGEELGLVAGLAHRNRWGLFRFTVAWTLASDYEPVMVLP
ncbi:MAG: hypothetical protein WA208_16880 [Thermoanaerobaculia bacterium]